MTAPRELDDDGLEALLAESTVPVLVDFYSPDCVACRGVRIHMGLLAERHPDDLVVALVDTDRHRRVAERWGVRGVPSIRVVVGGEVVAEGFGLYGVDHWEALAAPWLSGAPSAQG